MILLRIIAAVALVIIIIADILLIKMRLLKNKYYLAYEADPIVKVDDSYKKYKNIVYKPNKYVSKYITAYALSFGKKNTAMVSYVKSDMNLAYYILAYDKYHMPVKVIYIKDTRGLNHSSVIKLPHKTVDINIIMESVENEVLNPNPIKPVNSFKLMIFSLIWAIIVMCLFLITFYICTEVFATGFKNSYVASKLPVALIYIGVTSLCFMVLLFIILKLKNKHPRIKEVNNYAI